MGQYDFERLNDLLKRMDGCAICVRMKDYHFLVPFYAVLYEIYMFMRPIIFESKRAEYEDAFKKLDNMINTDVQSASQMEKQGVISQYKMNPGILKTASKLQMDLMEIRQIIGLGIQVDKQESNKTKLARALGVSHE
jgi:hypothetical protein